MWSRPSVSPQGRHSLVCGVFLKHILASSEPEVKISGRAGGAATRQSQGGHVLQHTLLHHRFTRGTSRCVEEDWDSKLIRKLFPEVINQLNEGRFEALLRWLPFVFYTVFGRDWHMWSSSITGSTSPALLMTKQPAILKPHHHYTCYKLQTCYLHTDFKTMLKIILFLCPSMCENVIIHCSAL